MAVRESRPLRLFDIRGLKGDINGDQEIKTSFAFNFGIGIGRRKVKNNIVLLHSHSKLSATQPSKLADYAANNMKPGKARGVVNLAATGLASYSCYQALQLSIGSYVSGATVAPTVGGTMIGFALGTAFAGLTAYDASLAPEYSERALEDFQNEEDQSESDQEEDDDSKSESGNSEGDDSDREGFEPDDPVPAQPNKVKEKKDR
jgi:hypothetical protein